MWQDAWAERVLAAGCDCCPALASLTPCQAAYRQSQAGTVPLLFLVALRIC